MSIIDNATQYQTPLTNITQQGQNNGNLLGAEAQQYRTMLTPGGTASVSGGGVPADGLVWPDTPVNIHTWLGDISTGITTRGLHDVLVMAAAVGFGIVGLILMFRRQIGTSAAFLTRTAADAA